MRLLRRALWTTLILFILLNILAIFHACKFTYFYAQGDTGIKKPEQMDTWDKTRAVLFGFNYTKSTNKTRPKIPFTNISLTTSDTVNLKGWYMANKLAKGTVILFHGHGSSGSAILDESYYMHSLGFNTCIVDFRAHGNSEGNVCTIGYEEGADVKAAYDYIRRRGEKNIILWGVSMGAAAITRAIADYAVKPEKAILEMSFGTLAGAAKGRVRTMGLPVQPIAGLLTFWGGTVRGFWAFDMEPQEYAKKIECPVLVQHGAKDPRVTLAETKTIYSNIPHGRKRLVIYETAVHESLCRREPALWKAEIKSFLFNY